MANIGNIVTWPYNGHENFVELRNRLSGKGQKDVFRIGASEVGTVLGLNEYCDPVTFFYEACDFKLRDEFRSLDAIRGINLEPVIYSEYWRYMDPTSPNEEKFLDNFLGERRVYRTATKSDKIYQNPEYDWLFVSPDYEIDGQPGLVECKSYKSYVLDKYNEGIPQAAVVQTHAQMMGTGREFVDLMMLVDATIPRLFTFNRKQPIMDWIDLNCREFVDRVLKGKEIVYSDLSEDEKEMELLLIAPDDDGFPKYSQYLKDSHKFENVKEIRDGTQEELDVVCKYLSIGEQIDELETEKLKHENTIREWYRGNNVGRIDFGSDIGSISYGKKLSIPKKILKKIKQ